MANVAPFAFFITYHKFHSVILQESRAAICFCSAGRSFGGSTLYGGFGSPRLLLLLLLNFWIWSWYGGRCCF